MPNDSEENGNPQAAPGSQEWLTWVYERQVRATERTADQIYTLVSSLRALMDQSEERDKQRLDTFNSAVTRLEADAEERLKKHLTTVEQAMGAALTEMKATKEIVEEAAEKAEQTNERCQELWGRVPKGPVTWWIFTKLYSLAKEDTKTVLVVVVVLLLVFVVIALTAIAAKDVLPLLIGLLRG